MPAVFITGVTGFIGGQLARKCLERGWAVSALVRDKEKVRALNKMGVQVIMGDLGNAEALRRGCGEADAVIHAAARSSDWGQEKQFWEDNVRGTERLANQAARAGVKRFVLLSTISVYGFHPPARVNEETPAAEKSYVYAETKLIAERVAAEAFANQPDRLCVARVASAYGPGSHNWTVRPVKLLREGRMFLIEDGEGLNNHVYVDNLVDGLVLCATHPAAAGETFILSDGVATAWKEFFGYYQRMTGAPPLRSLSRNQALAIAAGMELAARVSGKPPAITRAAIFLMCRHAEMSCQKARDRLGYNPEISLEEGMSRTRAWLKEQGLV
ncbi:MAG: 2-alkyl-3-oxoalkanoate reductase [Myxococcota bacterium]|nr:2-alkyl-3-oxoalkanoate reductase [Myxococcota bacterium]